MNLYGKNVGGKQEGFSVFQRKLEIRKQEITANVVSLGNTAVPCMQGWMSE